MLQVNNLHSGYYSDKKYTGILKNINMHVEDHEIVGVLGANGSGKTTLMKSINIRSILTNVDLTNFYCIYGI